MGDIWERWDWGEACWWTWAVLEKVDLGDDSQGKQRGYTWAKVSESLAQISESASLSKSHSPTLAVSFLSAAFRYQWSAVNLSFAQEMRRNPCLWGQVSGSSLIMDAAALYSDPMIRSWFLSNSKSTAEHRTWYTADFFFLCLMIKSQTLALLATRFLPWIHE